MPSLYCYHSLQTAFITLSLETVCTAMTTQLLIWSPYKISRAPICEMIEYKDSPFIKCCRRRPSNPGGEKWGEWMRWRGCWEGRFGWRGNTNPRNHRSRTSHWKPRGAGREGFGKCVHFVPCTMLYHTLCTIIARPQNLDIKEWMSRQNSIWSSLHGEE